MTIVRLKGGLGNQMFQYAAGFAAAKRSGQELFLDLSAYEKQFEKDTPREFELGAFNLTYPKLTPNRQSALGKLASRVRNKLFPENPYTFKPSVLKQHVLDGFYQNERYFLAVRELILQEFSLREASRQFSETQRFIRGSKSVSMHVRRGDYVTNPHANAHHGVLSVTYFKKAYEHIISKIGSNFTLFVFTDDVEWAQEQISFHPDTYVISGNGFSPAEELILMSQCAHNVISNSSFSWWAAWLNTNSDKIVVAPGHWTKDSKTSDIVPTSWTKI